MYNTKVISAERKIINVTGKRQITIPLKFYEKLRFGREIECFLTDDAVVLRPLTAANDSFTMEILKDLVSQGYSGDELLVKFAEWQVGIRNAISVLVEESDEIAAGERDGATTEDIFGED